MIVRVKFSQKQLADPKLTAMLRANGWEEDLIMGEDDAGKWFHVGAGWDNQDPRVVARKLLEPFLTIGHQPIASGHERMLLQTRLGWAARDISAHDVARANALYELADEVRVAETSPQ